MTRFEELLKKLVDEAELQVADAWESGYQCGLADGYDEHKAQVQEERDG